MDELFPRKPFTGFGPRSRHSPSDAPPLHRIRGRRPSRVRTAIRARVPRRPGVYGMLNHRGELIYVGKAKCLRSRMLSYYRPSSRDRRAARIARHARTLVWEECSSEFAALLRELELIRRWKPRCNVVGQPDRRRRTFVCLGRRPAPHVFLSARPPAGIVACFGPVPAGDTAREAARRLNDGFRLRDCPRKVPMHFAGQPELFPMVVPVGCLRHDIATCSGPCAGAVSREDYHDQVRAALAFLTGKDRSLLKVLEDEMRQAAVALAFERATAIREKWRPLHWLAEAIDRLKAEREACSFVYPVPRAEGGADWHLVHQGLVWRTVPAPEDEATRQQAEAAVEAVYFRKRIQGRFTPAEEVDGLLLVASWFRRHAPERAKGLTPAEALDRCRVPAGSA